MTNVLKGSQAPAADMPAEPAAGPPEPVFHVELAPVAVDARPFHAVHGVPGVVGLVPPRRP